MRGSIFWCLYVTGLVVFCLTLAVPLADFALNKFPRRAIHEEPWRPSREAWKIHYNSEIVDGQASPLMWKRWTWLTRPLEVPLPGHVDLDSLYDGNVAVQFWKIVTDVPAFPSTANDPTYDMMPLVAALELYPANTWFDKTALALHQARGAYTIAKKIKVRRLNVLATQEDYKLYFDDTRMQFRDQDAYIRNAKRFRPESFNDFSGIKTTATVLAADATALGGHLGNLDRLHDADIRIMGFAHYYDTEFAGSAYGLSKGGLTPLGYQLLAAIEAKGMIADVSFASRQTVLDVAANASRPVVCTRCGVLDERAAAKAKDAGGPSPSPIMLDTEALVAIANTGGVIGVGLGEDATGEFSVVATADAIRAVADVVGLEHVALGSGFDAGRATPIPPDHLILLTQALVDGGLNAVEVSNVMGGNWRRMLKELLPEAVPLI